MSGATGRILPTTLGPRLLRRAAGWTIDLSDLPLFHGLSVLSRALGEQLVERCQAECFDIDLERRVKPSENPELVALGCIGITVHAERDVVAHVPGDIEAFQHHLRAVFGTLQQGRWRRHLLPESRGVAPRALIFVFPVAAGFEYRFVMDRVPAPRGPNRFFLRIAIENPRGRRLDLGTIPHVLVDDLEAREYIAGSTRIAQTLRDLVHREADRGRHTHQERRKRGSFLFEQLSRSGLDALQMFHLTWSERFAGRLHAHDPVRVDHAIKRVLLLLEDRAVRRVLATGQTIELVDDTVQAFLDLSQQGRVVNIAFDQPRRRATVDTYLERMPSLAAVGRRAGPARPLAGVSCVLIHHITSEVLGCIAALRAAGCDDLDVLFVRYAGTIPNDYLDALLDLDRAVRSYTLQQVEDPAGVEGHFLLSQQLSPLRELDGVAGRLYRTPTRYLPAMVSVAVALFVRALERGRRVLVIEDGGYLVPELIERAATGATVEELAAAHGAGPVPRSLGKQPLRTVLEQRLIGSVEHTRNGHDRLAALARSSGFVRPAYSIAVSRLKIEEEAHEVASGILAAIEAVLHASGQVLSRRRPLVIGSRGAIGRRLVAALRGGRVPEGTILGLDLTAPRSAAGEARHWTGLPVRQRRALDLLIGVTGVSVLGPAEIEELVLLGAAPTLTFASGSTKTVEFRAVAEWVEALVAQPRPRIRRRAVEVTREPVSDPQSGRRYGTAFTLRFQDSARTIHKRLVFLADLTPVNFLFYGVPTEGIDGVMAQLFSAALAVVRDTARRSPPAPGLHVVGQS